MNIISLGPDCGVSIALRNLGLRKHAYPWDWARHTEVADIIEIIENQDTFVVENWKNLQNVGFYLPHDDSEDTHGLLENKYENVTLLEKYKRRFKRFFKHIREPNTYLVRFGSSEDVPYLEQLATMLPNAKIVYIEHGKDSDENTYNALRSVFIEEKDRVCVFLEKMMYISDMIVYPCTINDIWNELKQHELQEDLLTYIREYENIPSMFHDKYELMHLLYKVLETNGIEYCIL